MDQIPISCRSFWFVKNLMPSGFILVIESGIDKCYRIDRKYVFAVWVFYEDMDSLLFLFLSFGLSGQTRPKRNPSS